ncbi:hypothetical protein TeGR_g5451, partial [Tetraparma gracilis]
AGDGIPADCIIFEGSGVMCNESALTGEPDDLKKDPAGKDPFMLSSTVVTDTGTSGDAKGLVVGIGKESQWGKIKANLTSEPENTPLQDKLEDMVNLIGKGGAGAALLTFVALLAMVWIQAKDNKPSGGEIMNGVIDGFIIAVTIIVVAIPEGLPLAVTISLSYSSKQMLIEGNLIRQLQACETMGSATNICTDKTGTLTENRMTIVEGFFKGGHIDQAKFESHKQDMDDFSLNAAINGNVFLQDKDEEGKPLDRCKIIGSATEGALVLLLRKWGQDYAAMREKYFNNTRDCQFPFNSTKKRSTIILCDHDGKVKLLCKGASEVVLKDCTHWMDSSGAKQVLDDAKRVEFVAMIDQMADRALRTLAMAHKDYDNVGAMPGNYKEDPPDSSDLILDTIIGIIDPLRGDVKDAVATAQSSGVMVRMVTGDNIKTAVAIAKQCGILTGTDYESLTKERYESLQGDEAALNALLPKVGAIEGPCFRNLTPKQADMILQRVQVMARSSPDDKYLMVTRLNGNNLPKNEEEWKKLHPSKNYATDKDKHLPGYVEEWSATRPNGGQVVGVTGDGTNDAPALKASDVGLSMGITGTKVAQNASDIVITDDKFSSIVRAILWGRSVYDNIRRFLQFQLTVNVVALLFTFIGAVSGFHPPLNAVMMLWVNLIMDTMGALALGTEKPTPELLLRQPYLRDAPLVSKPMWRNILTQSAYQLILLLVLLFKGPSMFSVKDGSQCLLFDYKAGSANLGNSGAVTKQRNIVLEYGAEEIKTKFVTEEWVLNLRPDEVDAETGDVTVLDEDWAGLQTLFSVDNIEAVAAKAAAEQLTVEQTHSFTAEGAATCGDFIKVCPTYEFDADTSASKRKSSVEDHGGVADLDGNFGVTRACDADDATFVCNNYDNNLSGDGGVPWGTNFECYLANEFNKVGPSSHNADGEFAQECFDKCNKYAHDFTHYSILFNVFVFCQVFNEFNARSIKNDVNAFKGIEKSQMFLGVIVFTCLFQVAVVALGGNAVRTTMLDGGQWGISILLGLVSLPLGVIMRFNPIWNEEDPDVWFGYVMPS